MPEIIHRCSYCGASLKTALFCPQCGKPATPAPSEQVAETAEKSEVVADSDQSAPPVSSTENEQGSSAVLPTEPVAPIATREPLKTERHLTTTGRDMMERRVKPRVDQLRHASSVVLGEASYDPSVRFILVVAVVFVLFLVLMVLNKWLG
jgi:uncharacterized Zn finger protein (UPF0148 family)